MLSKRQIKYVCADFYGSIKCIYEECLCRSLCTKKIIFLTTCNVVIGLLFTIFCFCGCSELIYSSENSKNKNKDVGAQKSLVGFSKGVSKTKNDVCLNRGLRRSDFEFLNAWNENERNEALKVFYPTIYKIGSLNKIPQKIPEWTNKKRSQLMNSSALNYALNRKLKIHSALHMYHRQINYPDSAVKIGIDGDVFTDANFTSKYEGIEGSKWKMCSGNEDFKKALVENAIYALSKGVSIFEFQDLTRQYYSCFCKKCVADFKDSIKKQERMKTHNMSLLGIGINLNEFDVRKYAYNLTSGSSLERQRQFLWNINNEVSRAWLAFKCFQLRDFLEDVFSQVRFYAEGKSEKIIFLMHFYKLERIHFNLIDLFDGLWIETPLDQYVASSTSGAKKTSLGISYYPPSGIMSASAAVFAGFGLNNNKMTMWLPWGVAIPELAFKKGDCSTLYKIWLAETYANGCIAGIGYHFLKRLFESKKSNKRIISDLSERYFETSREIDKLWYTPKGVGEFSRFIWNHKELYDDFVSESNLLVLKTKEGYKRYGKKGENSFGWAELLGDAHIPYEVLIDGNGILMKSSLSEDFLNKYNQIIALGSAENYSPNHFQMIRKWLTRNTSGALVLFVEDEKNKWQKKLGQVSIEKIYKIEDMGGAYQKSRRSKLWIEKAKKTFRTPIETNANMNTTIKLVKNKNDEKSWLLHIVNRNYKWFSDQVVPQNDIRICLDKKTLGLTDNITLTIFELDVMNKKPLRFINKLDKVELYLPKIGLYSIIRIETT